MSTVCYQSHLLILDPVEQTDTTEKVTTPLSVPPPPAAADTGAGASIVAGNIGGSGTSIKRRHSRGHSITSRAEMMSSSRPGSAKTRVEGGGPTPWSEPTQPSSPPTHDTRMREGHVSWYDSFTCTCGEVVRAPAAKAGGSGFDIWRLPWVFFTSNWLTNVDGMRDLWCSSTVRLLSTQIRVWMGWRIYGALVQFSGYQHGYKWKGLWCSSTVQLLSTQTWVNVKVPSILG